MIARLNVVMFAACVAVAGCSSPGSSVLQGAVYASQIPVYPSAVYENAMGGAFSESLGGPATAESLSWFFKVSDPVEKVVAYYEGKLPTAGRSKEGGEVFTFVPRGAEAGESVSVTIRPGELQITEVVKPGKRKN